MVGYDMAAQAPSIKGVWDAGVGRYKSAEPNDTRRNSQLPKTQLGKKSTQA